LSAAFGGEQAIEHGERREERQQQCAPVPQLNGDVRPKQGAEDA
jgi:hypothetical protein